MAERSLTFAANWKMNHGPAEAREFAKKFTSLVTPVAGRNLWFFPPVVSLASLFQAFQVRADIRVGAQNAHWESKGAFTGEVSIPMVMEAGARLLLSGHSERRHLFGETDEQAAKKARAALASGLTPLLCVGETLTEREGGRTEQVIVRQLGAALALLEPQDWSKLVLAYEPVWAIGTGKNATPDDAAQIHELIRMELGRHSVTVRVPILYGGSVNADNVVSLLSRPQIDGVLVGGASLDPAAWAELVGKGSRVRALRPSGGYGLVDG